MACLFRTLRRIRRGGCDLRAFVPRRREQGTVAALTARAGVSQPARLSKHFSGFFKGGPRLVLRPHEGSPNALFLGAPARRRLGPPLIDLGTQPNGPPFCRGGSTNSKDFLKRDGTNERNVDRTRSVIVDVRLPYWAAGKKRKAFWGARAQLNRVGGWLFLWRALEAAIWRGRI